MPEPRTIGTKAIQTKKVAFDYALNSGSADHHIGLITLSTDYLSEAEFSRVAPLGEIAIHATRVRAVNPVTAENLRTMGPLLTEAASLLPDELDAIAYCCTSGTVAIGDETVSEQIHVAKPEVPVTTPIGGAVLAMHRLGMSRVTLVTPYVDPINQAMRNFLEANGVQVLNIASFCLESDLDMVRLPPEAIRQAAIEALHDDAEGLFISCTAIRALEVVESIERDLGKPALSAMQTLIWNTLRGAGYEKGIEGYGRLFHLPI